jgi:hypothetical protein
MRMTRMIIAAVVSIGAINDRSAPMAADAGQV